MELQIEWSRRSECTCNHLSVKPGNFKRLINCLSQRSQLCGHTRHTRCLTCFTNLRVITGMLGIVGTIAVIIIPIVLIAIMLAVCYFPLRRPITSSSGAGARNNNLASPYRVPSYELQTHRSSRLARISEEGGHVNHTAVHK
ncbi:hypothetical protein M434DRAFT_180470 [Hypoxylon sp. CO27-5]|nr:hypothetical protein M434DRAFT_180470 [Hypoxylon sp. CO27-5]